MGTCQSQLEAVKIFPADSNGELSANYVPTSKVKGGYKVLVSGLASCGKTSLILAMVAFLAEGKPRGDQEGRTLVVPTPRPSEAVRFSKLTYRGATLYVGDLPGSMHLRRTWYKDEVLNDTRLIVHLIDSQDEAKLTLSLVELERLCAVCKDRTKRFNLLIVATKQDARHPMDQLCIKDRIHEAGFNPMVPWDIFRCSVKSGEDLLHILQWIMNSITGKL